MLSRFAFRLHFVCEMCARPEGFVRGFRGAMASRATIFGTDHLPSGPPLFGTVSAHRPGHDFAKHAIRRHGLADAGSVFDLSEFHVIPTLSLSLSTGAQIDLQLRHDPCPFIFGNLSQQIGNQILLPALAEDHAIDCQRAAQAAEAFHLTTKR